MNPWLSVIMPIHGGEPYLDATLASAAAEKPEGVEFLLYDSGNDGGAARVIAERYAERLNLAWRATPEIVPWTAKTNLGAREAKAKHICMLHQDDLWLPGHLAEVRKSIAAQPDAAISIGPSRFVSAHGRLLGHWRLPFGTGAVSRDEFATTLLVQNTIAIPSPIIRREAWLACGGMDEALWYTADWDLYLKLAGQGAVLVRSGGTTGFRLHGGSLTMSGRRDIADFRRQHEIVLDRYLPTAATGQHNAVERRARTSITVNCALASASAGNREGLAEAVKALLGLGIPGIPAYLKQSRIVDRLVPRMRLALAGAM